MNFFNYCVLLFSYLHHDIFCDFDFINYMTTFLSLMNERFFLMFANFCEESREKGVNFFSSFFLFN